MRKPRLLLADDHTLVLEGFRRLLEPDFELVACVETGRELISATLKSRPDLILVDIAMPELNGFDAVRQIRKTLPDIKVIFLTMHTNPAYVSEAFLVGAGGYLLKRAAASELIAAIRGVLQGRYYISPSLANDLIDLPGTGSPRRENPVRRLAAGLTLRQKEVLQLLAEGHTYKEIAERLHISIKTVEFHRASLVRRLGLRTTAELTRYALEQGIISLEAPPR